MLFRSVLPPDTDPKLPHLFRLSLPLASSIVGRLWALALLHHRIDDAAPPPRGFLRVWPWTELAQPPPEAAFEVAVLLDLNIVALESQPSPLPFPWLMLSPAALLSREE